ncbi:PssE/Cps14G family polysaccharide biosynthesis glycosyltransferase [Shewanella algae]|uniref:PssE/Cps14G family polysaccharide biosynthesis glycosyltransferase n=1 Tax=Shewanella algae TaxID=38313 RepID=UPI001C590545|nr:PssE/Cps14G family polysaccharide biosynthesis glycosyltransferase [Shewanella algae]
MIRVLVIVGTTTFDTLISALDRSEDNISYLFQVAEGSYNVQHHSFETFIENVEELYSDFDLVITHAGAGTVYKLLEGDTPFLVVPNTERSDKHQLELAQFVGSNLLAKTCTVEELVSADIYKFLVSAVEFKRRNYCKKNFFIKEDILFNWW